MRYIEILAENLQGVLRDKNGNPLRLYHGTADTFTEFNPKMVHDKEGTSLRLGFGPGVLYFTDHPDDAFRYGIKHGLEGVNIHPVFLIMHKPFHIRYWDDKNAAWLRYAARGYGEYAGIKSYVARMRRFIRDLKAEGYDGIIVSDGKPNPPGEYVVFDPSQVISYLEPRGIDMRQRRHLVDAAPQPIIAEAPIGNLEVHKMDQPGTFPDVDRRLLTDPAHIQKMHQQFERVPFDFDLYFINQPGKSYVGTLEPESEMQKPTGYFTDEFEDDRRLCGVVSPDFLMQMFHVSIPQNPDAISVVYASNANDQGRGDMTPWIAAHRFAHALTEMPSRIPAAVRKDLEELPNMSSTILFRDFGCSVPFWKLLTSKSARLGYLNDFEYREELIAQYIITGRIRLALPEANKGKFDQETQRKIATYLDYFANTIRVKIERILENCVGYIFLSV